MRALVLSGGGVKGAWQAGVLRHLIGARGRRYDMICGISVGAINAAYLAQWESDLQIEAQMHLETMWSKLDTKRVYRKWRVFGRLAALWKPSIYDSRPLHEFVRENISADRISVSGVGLHIGAVSLRTGELFWWNEQHRDVVEGVLCSSAFPGVLTPVEFDSALHVDGGVRSITPLGAAIKAGADAIDVLVTSPEKMESAEKETWTSFEVLQQTIEIMVDEIAMNDLQVAAHINTLVEQGVSPNHRQVELVVYRPAKALVKDSLQFDPVLVEQLIEQGIRDAELVDSGEAL